VALAVAVTVTVTVTVAMAVAVAAAVAAAVMMADRSHDHRMMHASMPSPELESCRCSPSRPNRCSSWLWVLMLAELQPRLAEGSMPPQRKEALAAS
jgi:MFS superfamily sulfate permease-like transporter